MENKNLKYRPEVDGVRAIAVVSVLLYHMGFETFSGGFVGVDVFFVISGYLIGTIILTEVSEGRFSIVTFYERRARRILPALFLVLLITSVMAYVVMLPYEQINFGENLLGSVLFVSNITLYFQGGYFGGPAEMKALLHMWSLAIEEQFYIFFPLLAILCTAWIRKTGFVLLVLGLSLGSLILAELASFRAPTVGFYALPTRAWELGVGILVAMILLKTPRFKEPFGGIVSAIGLAAVFASILMFDETTRFPSFYALVPVVGTAMILSCASQENTVGRLLARPSFVGIGLISYSLYLWHQPLLVVLRMQFPEYAENTAVLLCVGLFAGLMAWGTWRYVEHPFRDRARVGRRSIFLFSAAGIIVFSAIGASFVLTRGFLFTVPSAQAELASLVPSEELDYVRAAYDSDARNNQIMPNQQTLFLIGDSYSQDLFNMIRETDSFEGYNIVARYVSSRCQIQMGAPPGEPAQSHADAQRCESGIGSLTPQIIQESHEADIVLLTGSWELWSATRIVETVELFDRTLGRDLFVVGRKSFGTVDFRQLLELSPDEQANLRLEIPNNHRETNDIMRQLLQENGFVDLYALFCDREYRCPQFTPDGNLLSVDGGHLTRDGARFLGELVFSRTSLAQFASDPSQ